MLTHGDPRYIENCLDCPQVEPEETSTPNSPLVTTAAETTTSLSGQNKSVLILSSFEGELKSILNEHDNKV